MSFSGGCQCGAVRYEIASARLVGYACHCRECQKQSASAFGTSVPVRKEDFVFTGETQIWSRQSDSGGVTDCHFCPKCGSRVFHSAREGRDWITVKGGSLDDPCAIELLAHIWVKRRMGWVTLPDDVQQWDTQPESREEWHDLLEWDV